MNQVLKTSLRVAFLLVLIWMLAALSGAVQGATLTVGSTGKKRQCGRGQGRTRFGRYTGMVGGNLVQNPGIYVGRAGVPHINDVGFSN